MKNATRLAAAYIRIEVPIPGLDITVPYSPRTDLDMIVRCTNREHDHTTTVDLDGMDVEPIQMLCSDCKLPSHWDEHIASYVHDDVDAPDCFMMAVSYGDPSGQRTACTFV